MLYNREVAQSKFAWGKLPRTPEEFFPENITRLRTNFAQGKYMPNLNHPLSFRIFVMADCLLLGLANDDDEEELARQDGEDDDLMVIAILLILERRLGLGIRDTQQPGRNSC
jgi:hypothetical protein